MLTTNAPRRLQKETELSHSEKIPSVTDIARTIIAIRSSWSDEEKLRREMEGRRRLEQLVASLGLQN